MLSITRKPRLLVKLSGAPEQAAFQFKKTSIDVQFERLFASIPGAGGLAATSRPEWYVMAAGEDREEVNAWDLCHHMLTQGFGVAGLDVPEFAEPDLQQRWTCGTEQEHAFAAALTGPDPTSPDPRLPMGSGFYWFRDSSHSELEAARQAVGQPSDAARVRIAHFDTGYDPDHVTRPQYLVTNLQRNFVDPNAPGDARDQSSGLFTNLGHGTGTISILAGAAVDGSPLGGAPYLGVVPIRVANSVVVFQNSAIARAFDYVHQLYGDPAKRVHVITMSMGGLASQAWADAVNALYELGVFIVTAAGNNFGNFPTHNIVYPARFKRVVAACGVMADGRPYADLPINIMAGNYGPASKMDTALSGCTPNTPWARFGSGTIVDHDGRGTSAATPQVAAAAALWIQGHKDEWERYPEGWMRVEAVRKALFESARLPSEDLRAHLGHGMLQAGDALGRAAANAADLRKQPVDSASFAFLRVITGLGIAAAPDARQRMLELEALQLTQGSAELERLLPDPDADVDAARWSAADRQRFVDALIATPGASDALRHALGAQPVQGAPPQVAVLAGLTVSDPQRLARAMNPPVPTPPVRRLRVYAYDPLVGTQLDTFSLNEAVLETRWEDLEAGPVGEYLEVVDVDPSSACCYAPVDLNQVYPLSQDGFSPSEANPQFHQQMAYAVAMKTIEHFEHALGRVCLWAPRTVTIGGQHEEHFVRRLRIYPHALCEANSFYSPEKKALLLGYFTASNTASGDNLPGGTVFCCLSHDVVAHETTHALLDGLHRRFREPTNPDVLAFHEAFADIVALFQHFTVPEALKNQIARTQGDLRRQNILGELAQQFGEAIGRYGALRSAIGGHDEQGNWQPAKPSTADYQNATEPHDRGAVLVAAVFNAFLDIYRARSADLVRLATGGTGVLPPGDIPIDLVNRLAQEASKSAEHVLNICIRALDYCPPVDITYGDYLRALITADHDLVPDDRLGYRIAFIQAFRRRGIYPANVRNLSAGSLCWESPEGQLPLEDILGRLSLGWDLHTRRSDAYALSRHNAYLFHEWLKSSDGLTDADALTLGFDRREGVDLVVNSIPGQLSRFEVHSVRPMRRIGPDGQHHMNIVVEITQRWTPSGQTANTYRGGCTLLIDHETRRIRYCIRKRVGHPDRVRTQDRSQMGLASYSLHANYFVTDGVGREPFAMLHRGI